MDRVLKLVEEVRHYRRRDPRFLVPYGSLAGLVSAILVIALSPYSVLCAGTIFGAVFVVYYFSFSSTRSIPNALGFLAVSTAGYGICFALAFFVGMLTSSTSEGTSPPTAESPIPFVIGGSLGAFLLVGAVLLFLSSTDRVRKILNLALICSVPGGFLGAVGWLIGVVIEQALGKGSSYSLMDIGHETVVAVWQTGMGLVLGILFAQEYESFDPTTALPPSKAQKVARLVAVSIAVVLLLQVLTPRLLQILRLR